MRDERDHVGGDNNKDDACSFKQPKLWDEGPNESGRIACKLTASFQSNQAEIIAADSRTMETNDNNHSSKQESDMVDRAKREQNEWGLMQIVESAESKQMRQRRLREGQRQTKPSPTVLLKTPAFATNTLDEQDLDGLVGDFGSASRADLDGVNQEMGARDIQLDGQLATNPSTRSSDPLADTTQNQLHQQQQQQQQHQQQQQQQLGTVTDSRRKSSRAERGLGSEDMTNRLATWSVENRTFHSPCSCSSAGAATSACFCSCDKRQDYIISSELRGENKTANQAEPSSVLVSEGSCKGGLRKEARPRESRVAAAEDFGVDGEEQRDGPTPTNDLIRALIHKDKLAFTGRCKLVRKTGDSATQGDRGATSGDGCCNCGQSGRLEPTKYELTRDNSELLEPKSKTNKPESSERTVDMADKGVGPSCHSDDKSARNSLEFGQMEQERRLFKSTTLESLQTAIGQRDDSLVSSKQDERRVDSLPKSNPQESSEILAENTPSRKRSLFDLSALISKCQQLQLSPDWATGKAVRRSLNNAHLSPYELASRTFISMSPRKPSDPTSSVSKELLDFAAATKQTQRRHSTYMLPLLLNRDGTTASDDDEEEEMLGLVRSTCELGNDNKRKTQNSGLLSVDSGEISSLGEVQARLTTSASSPSALSTPTNEFSGCGGPCCSQQAQLVKLATENASLSRKLFSREPFEQNGDSHTESSPAGRDSRKMSLHTSSTLFERKRSQRQKGEVRLRIGSNPLDRFTAKRASARLQPANNMFHVQRASKRSSGDAQPGTIHHSSWASDRDSDQMEKRHSIINLLSSGANQGAHHLVSRLSHPRSLFTGANHSSGRPIDAKRQRASIGCNLENEQPQYDPLIPESGFKIVVMGTSGSGKTSIIQRFMYNSFDWRHMPTVEDTYFIEFPHMKNTINISISDTSGTYQFPAMRKLAINSGDAFILVYSVDDPKSFEDLEQLRLTILEERERSYLEASCSLSSNDCTSSGCTIGAISSRSSISSVCNSQTNTESSRSDQRHWSLASLFNSNQQSVHNTARQQTKTYSQCQSVSSSLSSSSSCSSADNSRRSSISAAEAALKTRRTRHPPMVIVANKHDLPAEKHLVNSDEIEALVVIDWNNGFVRASAATNENINEIFQQVLKQARQPPTLTQAIISKRRKSLPPKLPQSMIGSSSHF